MLISRNGWRCHNIDLLQKYQKDISRIQQLADPCFTMCSMLAIAKLLSFEKSAIVTVLAIAGGLALSLTGQGLGLYRYEHNQTLWRKTARSLTTWALLVAVIMTWIFAQKTGPEYSRAVVLSWLTTVGIWLTTSHIIAHIAARNLTKAKSSASKNGYIGSREMMAELKKQWDKNETESARIIPIYLWQKKGKEGEKEEISTSNVKEEIKRGRYTQLIIEEPESSRQLESLMQILGDLTCPVLLLPRWMGAQGCQPKAYKIGNISALQLYSQPFTDMEMGVKRSVDLIVSTLLLIGLAPVLIAIGIYIKKETPGPALFKQKRYGINGKPFNCLKFRSMKVLENDEKVIQAKQEDPRFTKIGKILRKWSLDELPQLINVWRGEMSLVGPRPHAEIHNEFYRTKINGYMRRHSLKPGITGWSQVLGLRGETPNISSMTERIKADLHYINNWNLLFDLEILLLTLIRIKGPNAY